jgi:proteasome lid subunit RPN8/RPN11
VLKLYRMRNSEQSPYRYNIDPRDLVKAYREIDDNGWLVLGIYHSHTGSPAYPSPTDVRLAEFPPGSGEPAYPEALYYVVSVANREQPELRAFHIERGTVREEPLELVGEG